ncbi:MAG: biotin/lipoyl-binding protein [Lachnospiraceae bacterium]|nr:biotin/lipoyl-binding protein [Lachnospiraceae bacterium]
MSDIFRKTALEKISSPDQLDEVIVITPPSFWLAMIGMGAILLTALIWSIFGRIPVNVSANGLYMTDDGIHVVYSEYGGTVEEVLVKDGETIKKGDLIARFSSTELLENKALLEKRREEVENVTIDSTGDIANADNKSLLDIKSQLLTLKSTLNANEEMLASRQKQLADLQTKANAAQNRMQQARSMYYGYMTTDSTTLESINFQQAQNDLSTTKNYYESAKSQLANFNAQNGATIDYLKDRIQRLEEQRDALDKNDPSYQAAYDQYQEQIYEAQSQKDSLSSQRGQYEQNYYQWETKLNEAQDAYYNNAFTYISKESVELHKRTFDAQLTDDYNLALNDYNTILSQLRSVEDSVSQLTVQTSSEEASVVSKYAAMEAQFDAGKAAILSGLDKEERSLDEQLKKTELHSASDGYIVGLNIAEGNVISQGTAICRIVEETLLTPAEGKETIRVFIGDAPETEKKEATAEGGNNALNNMAAILYVPVDNGKKIKTGMEVKVYPSTVNRQEYGHINAFVTHVDEYVTSMQEMKNKLGDDSLVQSFSSGGPVVQVMCFLKLDPSTKSGYDWSSRKGASVELSPGTPVSADIVTESKAPITMLIPFLKEKLTVKVQEEDKS